MDSLKRINVKLIPIKLHYFLYFGAQAGILPFLSIIAGQLGISVNGVAVIFSVLPFVTLAAKPFFGGIADHFQKLKLVLAVFITISTVSSLGLKFVPRMHLPSNQEQMEAVVFCTKNGSSLKLTAKDTLHADHFKNNFTSYVLNCQPCVPLFNWTEENTTVQLSPSLDIFLCYEKHHQLSAALTNYSEVRNIDSQFQIENASWNNTKIQASCLSDHIFNCSLHCDMSNDCFNQLKEPTSIYISFQFWLLFFLIMLVWISAGVITSLSDAACYEVLEGKHEQYGNQRMWGAVGWGLFSLLTGYLNNIITGHSSYKDYSASFYMLAALMFLDFFTIAKLGIRNAKLSRTSLNNVCVLFTKVQIVVFIFTVFIIGGLTGLHWTYFFWYMNDLKAGQLEMGLALGIESFIGELPFFFLAGKIISKIGHVHAISLTLLFFFIRYLLYYFIYNPWLVLPVELTQGLTFGIFYAAMTSYAKCVAPSGSEATMQGVLGGMFEGLGLATGSLLGGLSISNFGTHGTFLIAGVIALVCCILHAVFSLILFCLDKKTQKEYPEKQIKDDEGTSFIS